MEVDVKGEAESQSSGIHSDPGGVGSPSGTERGGQP